MTEIIPFRGITYNPGIVPLSKVIASADDFLSQERRNAAYDQHPNNIARLLAPAELTPASDSVRLYQSWSTSGVLVEERTPVLYIIEQIFKNAEGEQVHARGFIARWKFPDEPQSADSTASPDAARVVDTTFWGNPMTALYDDPTRRIDRYISFAVRSAPLLNVVAGDVRTTIWKLGDGGAIAGIVREMKEKKVVLPGTLAGYESACSVRALCRSGNSANTGNEPFQYMEAVFFNVDNSQIKGLPLHRCIRLGAGIQPSGIKAALEQAFVLTEITDRAQLDARLNEEGIRAAGIALRGEQNFLLGVLKELPDEVELAGKRYAPAIFDECIRTASGDGAGESQAHTIEYAPTVEKGWELFDGERADVVCFLPPISIDRIRSMMSSEQAMPDRIFDIYPHVPLGLVFHKIFE